MKMQHMSEYFYLTREIEKQQSRLTKLRNEPFGAIPGLDVPKCKDMKDVDKYTKMIEESIHKSIDKAMTSRLKVSGVIDSIEDPRLREIMRDRFLERLSWQEVGKRNYIHPDHARKLVKDYFAEK